MLDLSGYDGIVLGKTDGELLSRGADDGPWHYALFAEDGSQWECDSAQDRRKMGLLMLDAPGLLAEVRELRERLLHGGHLKSCGKGPNCNCGRSEILKQLEAVDGE